MTMTLSPISARPVDSSSLVDLRDHLVGVGDAVDDERLDAPGQRHAAADRLARA